MNFLKNSVKLLLSNRVWRKIQPMICSMLYEYWRLVLSMRYARKMKNLTLDHNRKRRIVFLVNETSKWKYQKLYSLLKEAHIFEVDIVLTIADVDWNLSNEGRKEKLLREREFFRGRKMATTIGYDMERNYTVPLRAFAPDIVIYQQPWLIAKNQAPREVSKCALTLYAPYYIPTYVNPKGACDTFFHRELFAHFVINDSLKNYFLEYCGNKYHAGDFFALGHPMIDDILQNIDSSKKVKCAIYAPHWSMPHLNTRKVNSANLSTFLEYGENILEFAKTHAEIKWIYKPHPSLYRFLVDYNIWSREKADAYYKQWERVGTACYDGDYLKAFNESSVMITDCDSFLAEYALTGKPIVHLIGIGVGNRKFSPYGALFDTYYQVRSNTELIKALQDYVVMGGDPNRAERLKALSDSGLLKAGSAERIEKYIEHIALGNVEANVS